MTRIAPRSLCATLAAALAAVLVPACTSVEPVAKADAPRKVLQGSVLYREKVPLPDNAQVKVQVVDAISSAPVDIVVAETTIATAGRQVPVPFSLGIDALKAEPGRLYTLRAYILVDGTVRYVTTGRVNVDPNAMPASVSILVSPGTIQAAVPDSPAPPGATRPPTSPSRSMPPKGWQQAPKK